MRYFLITFTVYLFCFAASFWALSSVKFDRFCDVHKPGSAMSAVIASVGFRLSGSTIFIEYIFVQWSIDDGA